MSIKSLTCIKEFKDYPFTVGKTYKILKKIDRDDGYCNSSVYVNDDNGQRHMFNLGVSDIKSDITENYFKVN